MSRRALPPRLAAGAPAVRFIACLCFLSLAGLPAFGQVIAAAQRHFDAAMRLAAENKTDEAVREFEAAVDIEPDYGEALYQMGALQMKAGRARDAARSFIRLSQIEPDRPRGHLSLGLIFASLGNLDHAELEFKLALKIDPQDGEVRYNLALAEARERKYDDAKRTLAPLLAALPSTAEAHRLMANLDAETRDYGSALAEFERVAQLRPDDPKSYIDLGNLFAAAPDYERAQAAFEKAIALSSGNAAEARIALARAAHALGRDREALSALAPVLGAGPNPDALVLRGLSYEQLQDFAAAERDYRSLIEATPGDYRGHQLLGSMLLDRNDVPGAIAELEAAVHLAPDFAEAHLELAKAYLKSNRVDEAEKQARSTLELAPDTASAHYLLGQVLERRGDRAAAQAEFAVVQRLNQRARSTPATTEDPPVK